jgi:glycosyltransferase involved in cell wall biosynthesis
MKLDLPSRDREEAQRPPSATKDDKAVARLVDFMRDHSEAGMKLDVEDKAVGRPANIEPGRKQPQLRVLQVGKFYPPHMGGIETHLQALCGALRPHADVRVIVSSDDRNTVEELVDSVPVARLATLLTAFSTSLSPAMVSRIRNSQAELVHIHLPNPAAVLAYLASGHRGRLIVTYHSDTVKQKFLGRMFEPLLNAALRKSAAIIATSPNYLATSPVLQAFRDRCHIIPYGIDTEQFEQCDAEAVRGVRERFGERLVVSVGRLVYYKGFEVLIRAMASVHGKLVIVGDGPLRGELESLAARLGVTGKVVFAGEINNAGLNVYYHAADLFALASVARSEAFGIVQIEAMAAGLPVVNTSLDSGVPFVSLDGETGLTVPPGNAPALAAAINRLLDDAGLRQTLGQAGARRAKQEFSLDSMLRRTLQLYESVAATG